MTGADDTPRRFADIAVERGYCSRQQADECLQAHLKLQEIGLPDTIANVFVRKKVLTKEQALAVERALRGHTRIAGYEILEKVGQGGMGAVFRARQLSMDRIVALKILPPKLAANKAFVDRFFREARASARLNHPNVIQGIDVGESGGYYYFAMEFVEGPTVRKMLQEKGLFPPEEALDIVSQIARALEHAWKNGLVHRDVKPDNIMIAPGGIAKLCDLGLARVTEQEDELLAREHRAVGTPHYMAPEQARGQSDVDIRADIYSLGATFYHMTVGRTLFSGPSTATVMTKHLVEEASLPVEDASRIPYSYLQVMAKMMAKDREDRYQTPAELLKDLEALKKGRTPELAAAFRGKSSMALPRPPGQRAGPAAAASPRGGARGKTTGPHPEVGRVAGEGPKAVPPAVWFAGSAGAVAVIALAVILFARGGGASREGDGEGGGRKPRKGRAEAGPEAPSGSGSVAAPVRPEPEGPPGAGPARPDREAEAERALAECLARLSRGPLPRRERVQALEALRAAMAGTKTEAKLAEALAAERAAWEKEYADRLASARVEAERLLESGRCASAASALARVQTAGAPDNFAAALAAENESLKKKIAAKMEEALAAVRKAAEAGDARSAREALARIPEREVPAEFAAAWQAAADSVAAAEKRAAEAAERARASDPLYGKFLAALIATARRTEDVEQVLNEAREAAKGAEYRDIAARISGDIADLEECLKLEEAALRRWVEADKGKVMDLPKELPGIAKGRLEEAKGRRLFFTGGTSGGPTFSIPASQIKPSAILARSGLDLDSPAGALAAAAYLLARGDVEGARKRIDPVINSGGPAVAAFVAKLAILDRAAIEMEAGPALAELEKKFGAEPRDAARLTALLDEYSKKYGGTRFAASEEARKRIERLHGILASLDPIAKLVCGRPRRLPDGWYEVKYDFDDPAQAADFTARWGSESGVRTAVNGGALWLLTRATPDSNRPPPARGNLMIEWKPKAAVESLRSVRFRLRVDGEGFLFAWALGPHPGAQWRDMSMGRWYRNGVSPAAVEMVRFDEPRLDIGNRYFWMPGKESVHEISMGEGGRWAWTIDGRERASGRLAFTPVSVSLMVRDCPDSALDDFAVQFKPKEGTAASPAPEVEDIPRAARPADIETVRRKFRGTVAQAPDGRFEITYDMHQWPHRSDWQWDAPRSDLSAMKIVPAGVSLSTRGPATMWGMRRNGAPAFVLVPFQGCRWKMEVEYTVTQVSPTSAAGAAAWNGESSYCLGGITVNGYALRGQICARGIEWDSAPLRPFLPAPSGKLILEAKGKVFSAGWTDMNGANPRSIMEDKAGSAEFLQRPCILLTNGDPARPVEIVIHYIKLTIPADEPGLQ
ncbi:MAG: protein kinase [Planctomycetota bacterium]|nr:protein kinase [Planctomycetota bacterium]